MKALIYAAFTFVGVFVLAALIRGITKEILEPGIFTFAVNIGTMIAIFYLPYKVYGMNKEEKSEAFKIDKPELVQSQDESTIKNGREIINQKSHHIENKQRLSDNKVWKYTNADKKLLGPFSISELQGAFKRKAINQNTLIFHSKDLEWKKFSEWLELESIFEPRDTSTENPVTDSLSASLLITCKICQHKYSKFASECPKCSNMGKINSDEGEISKYVFFYEGQELQSKEHVYSLWEKGLLNKNSEIKPNNSDLTYKIKYFPQLVEHLKKESNQAQKKISLLINCPNCSSQVSIRAKECPKCNFLLKVQCSLCKNEISSSSLDCPVCGDPEPFAEERKYKKNNKLFCPECGADKTHVDPICMECGAYILPGTETREFEHTRKRFPCPACQRQISERAKQCPNCNNPTTLPCQVCESLISVWNKKCPQCGDPEPFN